MFYNQASLSSDYELYHFREAPDALHTFLVAVRIAYKAFLLCLCSVVLAGMVYAIRSSSVYAQGLSTRLDITVSFFLGSRSEFQH